MLHYLDFLYFSQVELSWTLLSTAHLVTPTPWSTRSATASDSTTYFEVYLRLSRVMTLVWRRSPRWRLEIFALTPTPPRNTKAATIPNRGTKHADVGISRIRHLTTTWATLVRCSFRIVCNPQDLLLAYYINTHLLLYHLLCYLQMTPAQTPSRWTR